MEVQENRIPKRIEWRYRTGDQRESNGGTGQETKENRMEVQDRRPKRIEESYRIGKL